MKDRLTLLILGLCISIEVFGVQVSESMEGIGLGSSLFILKDEESKFESTHILAGDHRDRFVPSATDSPNFGISNSTVWLKFDLNNPSSTSRDVVIEYAYPMVDSILFFVRFGDEVIERQQQGDRYIGERPFMHRNPAFPVVVRPGTTTVYFQMKTTGSLSAPLRVWTLKEFNKRAVRSSMLYSFGVGICLVMVFYNLFMV